MAIVLCLPACWPAKFHTKQCLELQNNATNHMTFVGMANTLARLVIVAMHMPICLVFLITHPNLLFTTSLS